MKGTGAIASDATDLGPEQEADAVQSSSSPLERLRSLPRKRLALVVFFAVVLLALVGAGIWFALDPLLSELNLGGQANPEESRVNPAVFFDLPDMVVNIDAPNGQILLLRASIVLELPSAADLPLAKALLPRIQDSFQVPLRSLTPDDLKGTAQTYRLRQELLKRVALALGQDHVRQVWFRELLAR
ncbi:MAG TPA: flagellar basal body-associated FliL family protein [Alphaproteobacteria bacterium]|nr:flagellar basal body-associated FliL family protein [Alphaproteobacteria bacterium]